MGVRGACVRFQSTLRKAVAQLPKAQLLQSKGGSLAAAS